MRIVRTCFYYFIRILTSAFGLATINMIYLLVGALIFYKLESPKEDLSLTNLQKARTTLVTALFDAIDILKTPDAAEKEQETQDMSKALDIYEQALASFYRKRTVGKSSNTSEGVKLWTEMGSVIYAFSVVTTIGWGNIVPSSGFGRIATIFYGSVGIPLLFTLSSEVGNFTSKAIRLLTYLVMGRCWCFRQGVEDKSMNRYGNQRVSSKMDMAIRLETQAAPDSVCQRPPHDKSLISIAPRFSFTHYDKGKIKPTSTAGDIGGGGDYSANKNSSYLKSVTSTLDFLLQASRNPSSWRDGRRGVADKEEDEEEVLEEAREKMRRRRVGRHNQQPEGGASLYNRPRYRLRTWDDAVKLSEEFEQLTVEDLCRIMKFVDFDFEKEILQNPDSAWTIVDGSVEKNMMREKRKKKRRKKQYREREKYKRRGKDGQVCIQRLKMKGDSNNILKREVKEKIITNGEKRKLHKKSEIKILSHVECAKERDKIFNQENSLKSDTEVDMNPNKKESKEEKLENFEKGHPRLRLTIESHSLYLLKDSNWPFQITDNQRNTETDEEQNISTKRNIGTEEVIRCKQRSVSELLGGGGSLANFQRTGLSVNTGYPHQTSDLSDETTSLENMDSSEARSPGNILCCVNSPSPGRIVSYHSFVKPDILQLPVTVLSSRSSETAEVPLLIPIALSVKQFENIDSFAGNILPRTAPAPEEALLKITSAQQCGFKQNSRSDPTAREPDKISQKSCDQSSTASIGTRSGMSCNEHIANSDSAKPDEIMPKPRKMPAKNKPLKSHMTTREIIFTSLIPETKKHENFEENASTELTKESIHHQLLSTHVSHEMQMYPSKHLSLYKDLDIAELKCTASQGKKGRIHESLPNLWTMSKRFSEAEHERILKHTNVHDIYLSESRQAGNTNHAQGEEAQTKQLPSSSVNPVTVKSSGFANVSGPSDFMLSFEKTVPTWQSEIVPRDPNSPIYEQRVQKDPQAPVNDLSPSRSYGGPISTITKCLSEKSQTSVSSKSCRNGSVNIYALEHEQSRQCEPHLAEIKEKEATLVRSLKKRNSKRSRQIKSLSTGQKRTIDEFISVNDAMQINENSTQAAGASEVNTATHGRDHLQRPESNQVKDPKLQKGIRTYRLGCLPPEIFHGYDHQDHHTNELAVCEPGHLNLGKEYGHGRARKNHICKDWVEKCYPYVRENERRKTQRLKVGFASESQVNDDLAKPKTHMSGGTKECFKNKPICSHDSECHHVSADQRRYRSKRRLFTERWVEWQSSHLNTSLGNSKAELQLHKAHGHEQCDESFEEDRVKKAGAATSEKLHDVKKGVKHAGSEHDGLPSRLNRSPAICVSELEKIFSTRCCGDNVNTSNSKSKSELQSDTPKPESKPDTSTATSKTKKKYRLLGLFGLPQKKKPKRDRWAAYRPQDTRTLQEDLVVLKRTLGDSNIKDTAAEEEEVEIPLIFIWFGMSTFLAFGALVNFLINDGVNNDFLVSFYFVYVLCSTIGFGDILPDEGNYWFHLFYGLTGVSMFNITVNATLQYMMSTLDYLKVTVRKP